MLHLYNLLILNNMIIFEFHISRRLYSIKIKQFRMKLRFLILFFQSLVKFSHELLDDWFSFLPSQARWKDKFEINAARMEKVCIKP